MIRCKPVIGDTLNHAMATATKLRLQSQSDLEVVVTKCFYQTYI